MCNTLQLGTLNHTYMKAVAAAVIVETPEVCKLCGTWWWMFGGEGRWGHLKGENGMAISVKIVRLDQVTISLVLSVSGTKKQYQSSHHV